MTEMNSPPTRDWTGHEVRAESERLEREAATILGYMIFELSRVEMVLGLMLSWKNDGVNLEAEAKRVEALTFHERLMRLESLVTYKYSSSHVIIERYATWLYRAHAIRQFRNEFLHGRWGVQATRQRVVNVIGLPNAPGTEEKPYALSEIEAVLRSVKELAVDLIKLRDQHPV